MRIECGVTVPTTWWPHEVVGHTDEAKKEINAIFADADTKIDFVIPKPTRLIERILHIAADADALILDSFAGSGTTAMRSSPSMPRMAATATSSWWDDELV